MKILFVMCSLLLSVAMSSFAEGKFTIKDITSGVFSAKYVTGMRALPDGETYARISNDGKQIVSYYYKNGQQASILMDFPLIFAFFIARRTTFAYSSGTSTNV